MTIANWLTLLIAMRMMTVNSKNLFNHPFQYNELDERNINSAFLFTIISEFLFDAHWQHANHTTSEEKGGDYRAMASNQGASSEG